MTKNWTPPKSMKLRFVEGRKLPYGVFWSEQGKRKSKYFETDKEQVRFGKEMAGLLDDRDVGGTLSPKEFEEWVRFRELTHGAPLDEIALCWARFGNGSGGEFVKDLIEPFKTEKAAKGISADMQTQYKNHMRRFNRQFGDRRMDMVSPSDLLAWLQSLPYAPITRSNHRKSVRSLYSWAMDRGYCRTNPAKIVEDEKVITDIVIATVEHGRTLLEKNMDSLAIGRLALEMFGCFRYSSAARLRYEDINWEEKGITLPPSQLKTEKRIYVDGHPDVLWEWLEYAPRECWDMPEREYLDEKSAIFRAARVPHPFNVLRHSSCTYHYAAYKNPGLTAALMAHTNLRTMEQHYRGRATQKQGLEWFSMRPKDFLEK